MKYEGKAIFKAVARDFKSGQTILSYQVDRATDDVIRDMIGKKLRIIVEDWKEDRSLDSNKYMWLLTSKIAAVLTDQGGELVTKEEVHSMHISQFNKPHLIFDEPVIVRYPASADISREEGYWRYYNDSKDRKYIYYYKLKGSSDFTSREMTEFLQQIVIPDAEAQGIETATPEELERMEKRYGKALEKRSSRRHRTLRDMSKISGA